MTLKELYNWWCDKNGFGACGCGQPDAVAELLRDVLATINDWHASEQPKDHEAWTAACHAYLARLYGLLPTKGALYAFLWRLSQLDLEEHGGSTPGWLTRKGEEVLAALKEYGTDTHVWQERVMAMR